MKYILSGYPVILLLLVLTQCKKKTDDGNSCTNASNFALIQYGNSIAIYINKANGGVFEISYFESNSNLQAGQGNIFRTYSTDTTMLITNLQVEQGKTYFFYIRTVCSESQSSEWEHKQTLYINPFTHSPYNIQVNDGVISWQDSNSNPAALKYQIQCEVEGTVPGTGRIYGTRDKLFSKAAMLSGFKYDIYVRTFTDQGKGWSNWTGPVLYTCQKYQYFCLDPTEIELFLRKNASVDSLTDMEIRWEQNGETVFQYAFLPPNSPLPTNQIGWVFSNNKLEFFGNSKSKYDFYLRSICQNNDTGAWKGPMIIDIK